VNTKEFGEYIKMLRIKNGYKSQRQLAEASGISNGTIARIENGTQKPTLDTLKTLSKYLNTDYVDLLLKAGYLPVSYLENKEDELPTQEESQLIWDYGIEDENREFAQRLRNARKTKKLTQEELATLVGTTKTTISNYETGYSTPSFEMLNKIANVLDVTTDYLLGRSDVPQSATNGSVRKSISKSQLKTFSNRLSAGIEKLGLSIESVANACRVSEAYIKELIHEPKQLPGVSTLYKLADLLGVTPDYLGGFTHDPQGVSPDTPKPKDLKEFLETQSVMYDGIPLTDEDKEKINMVLQALFLDAKKRNKRK
jgi:transcriptional regulator with XRE-family HTH domain